MDSPSFSISEIKQCRITSDILSPKLPHQALHVIGIKIPDRRFAGQLPHTGGPREGIAWIGGKCRIGRFMNDPLGRDTELIATD